MKIPRGSAAVTGTTFFRLVEAATVHYEWEGEKRRIIPKPEDLPLSLVGLRRKA